MADYAAAHIKSRDEKANALRQRQLDDQRTFERLRNRTDYVVEPGISGTRDQSLQRAPIGDFQRMPVGEQIVRNPTYLEKAIVPAREVPAAKPRPVSAPPKAQQVPLKNILTGALAKKWPTSFKKAYHQPTSDERILKGLNNLDIMSEKLLGTKRR